MINIFDLIEDLEVEASAIDNATLRWKFQLAAERFRNLKHPVDDAEEAGVAEAIELAVMLRE